VAAPFGATNTVLSPPCDQQARHHNQPVSIKESNVNKNTKTSGMNFKAPTTELSEAELEKATGGGGHVGSGAGAGKITFKEFSITKNIDKSSPIF
jgi:hypothetical protein